MDDQRKDKAAKSRLRRRAEKIAPASRKDLAGMSGEETAALVHELDVHHVELEMQNEELQGAQKELELSRDRYVDLWDFAPVAYFTLSDKILILEANLTAVTLLGVKRSLLINKKFTKFVASDSQDAFYLCMKKVSEKNVTRCELEMVRKDSDRFFAELHGIAISNAGNKGRYHLAVTDITERKRAEEQVRRQAKMLDLVGEAVIAEDMETTITYWNDAAEKMYGWRRDEAIGRNAIGLLVPEASRKEAEEILATLKKGESWAGEFTVKRKDGIVFPSLFNITPILDEKGKPAGILVASRDITQRKRMEESLRRSQGSLAEAQRIANLGSWEWLVKTGRMRWSPNLYRILGLDSGNFVPTFGAILNIVHPDDRELFAQAANNALTQKKPYDIELKIVRTDGVVRTFHFVAEVKCDETGRPVKLVGTAQDITERKKEEEQMRVYETLATLGKVVGGISHELRNPLGVIDSSVFYLQRHLKKSGGPLEKFDEKAQVHLERIHSSVMRATSIIQGLLNLTRVKELQVQTLDFRAAVGEIIDGSKLPATVEVMRDFPEQPVMVNADRELLRMAFENMMKNAVQAMEGKGTLTVAIRNDGKDAELTFSDTGPGISEENLEKIFQPLFSTKPSGTGLGLSMTRMIVERHGGTIIAQSTPGKGATFIIRLPLAGLSL